MVRLVLRQERRALKTLTLTQTPTPTPSPRTQRCCGQSAEVDEEAAGLVDGTSEDGNEPRMSEQAIEQLESVEEKE